MISRFEYDVQTQNISEVFQRLYRNSDGEILILDDGIKCPDGYTEISGIDENCVNNL